MSENYMDNEEKANEVNAKQMILDDIYEQAKADIGLDLYKVEPRDTRSDEAFA